MDWRCPECRRSFRRKGVRHSCVRMSAEDFLGSDVQAATVYAAVRAFIHSLGPVDEDVTKTQIGWKVRGGPLFAWFWLPYRVLHGRPRESVVSFASSTPVRSSRIKESVQTGPGRWIHHLVLPGEDGLDARAKRLLRGAYVSFASQARAGPD